MMDPIFRSRFTSNGDSYPITVLFSPFQASASTLLASLERERELLKVFLRVSQMENSTLRRMNLCSFLMVSERDCDVLR